MGRAGRLVLLAWTILPLGWSVACLWVWLPRILQTPHWHDAQLTSIEMLALVHVFLVLTTLVMGWEVAASSARRHVDQTETGPFRRLTAWLAASCALAPAPVGITSVGQPATAVPVGTLLSPTIASAVLGHILRRRRQQAMTVPFGAQPSRLTEQETSTLWRLRAVAKKTVWSDSPEFDVAGLVVDEDVRELLDGVERGEPLPRESGDVFVDKWSVVVRLFGYPVVEGRNGDVAQFRKRRALELLTWLVLNRDRSRRSAARNAIWDVDINDSTFSTVVSDMRRSLGALDRTVDPSSWCPTTFSDEIILSSLVVTDSELLAAEARQFLIGGTPSNTLVEELSRIRDMPLAGTSYSWADLDGTTTRLIIQATDVAHRVGTWALENDDYSLLNVAVGAGLRVMPGNESLLDLQAEILPAVRGGRKVSLP